jgi:hypothetical protein
VCRCLTRRLLLTSTGPSARCSPPGLSNGADQRTAQTRSPWPWGFKSCDDIWDQGERLIPLLRRGSALTPSDWTRTLLAVEIVWISAVVGAGWDASILFSHADAEAVGILRSMQRKLLDAGVIRVPPR